MITAPRLAHVTGLLAAAALIPFMVEDVRHLLRANTTWFDWVMITAWAALFFAVAYGLGWGLVRLIALPFRRRNT